MDETKCLFVSTRGLSKSCDMFPSWDSNDRITGLTNFTFNNSYGCSIYLHFDMVEPFINMYLDKMSQPFVLVSGNSDHSCPVDFPSAEKLLNSDKLICWYSQNVVIEHPKIKHIPIGLDYHTLSFNRGKHDWCDTVTPVTPKDQEIILKEIRKNMKPLNQCSGACTNFHLCMDGPIRRLNYRVPLYNKLKDKTCITWLPKQTREDFWKTLNDYAFCLSPKGNGEDCHRTWEILSLGRIPIIERSVLNHVFEGLPIVEVEDWSIISDVWLKQKHADILFKFHNKEYKVERLLLTYWKNIFNSHKN
jgi:hypothetical protein